MPEVKNEKTRAEKDATVAEARKMHAAKQISDAALATIEENCK
jgi:hypothetical protein